MSTSLLSLLWQKQRRDHHPRCPCPGQMLNKYIYVGSPGTRTRTQRVPDTRWVASLAPGYFPSHFGEFALPSAGLGCPSSTLAAASDPPLAVTHFTAIVKHNDSYPGEKLGSILYFITSKRTFFTFPQSAASRNRTINLRKGFHQDRWSSQETTLF